MKGYLSHEEMGRFIDLVCQNTTLYDPAAKRNDNQTTKSVWCKIAAEMNIPSLSAAEWKSKWKCLRDTFVKKKKDIRLADSQKKINKATQWKFFDRMLFLDPFVDRLSHKLVPLSDGNDYQHYTIIRNADYAEGDSEAEQEDGEEVNYSYGKHPADESLNSSSSRAPKRRRSTNNNIKDELDLEETGMSPSNTEEENEPWNAIEGGNSKSFFMSCAYRMEKLPESVQSYLQLQISQLFFNAENPTVPPVPIMPLPSSSSSSSS